MGKNQGVDPEVQRRAREELERQRREREAHKGDTIPTDIKGT